MLNTVIAVNADLASRLAIRYVCRLGRAVDLTIDTLHVLKLQDQEASLGTGWVRQTWEDAVLQRTMNQVTRLVMSEQAACRILHNPQFLTRDQDPDEQAVEELRLRRRDLFVEGLLHRFDASRFRRRIGSKLYREAPCPILMVKNLVDLSRGMSLVMEKSVSESVVQTFLDLFPNRGLSPEVLIVKFGKGSSLREVETRPEDRDLLMSLLESRQGAAGRVKTVEGTAGSLASLVRNHSLIVSELPGKKSSMAEFLGRSPSSILFCTRP